MPEANGTKGCVRPILLSVTSTVLGGALLWVFGLVGGDTINLGAGNIMPNEAPAIAPQTLTRQRDWAANQRNVSAALAQQTTYPAFEHREFEDLEIDGTWYGDDGWLYEIEQPAEGRVYVEGMNPSWPTETLEGNGTIQGHELYFRYQLFNGVQGEARFKLSSDGSQLTGGYQHGLTAALLVLRRASHFPSHLRY